MKDAKVSKGRRLVLAAAALTLAGLAHAASAQISEFPLPHSAQPVDIAPGPGGMWFTERTDNLLGLITPNGSITEFPINRPASRVVTGPDGNVWFTSKGFLSRMTPAGVVTDFPTAGTAYAAGIAVGPDGNLWFTEAGQTASYIARATVDGRITEFKAGEEPDGITAGPDGNLWFADFGEFGPHRIGRITPSGSVTEFPLDFGAAPRNITTGPDGNLWLTEAGGAISRITVSGSVTSFPVPGTPQGITAAPDGGLWFTELVGNKIGRITSQGAYVEFALPSPNAQPIGIAAAPDGAIWFAERGTGRIGRIGGPKSGGANALLLSGGRYQVVVAWRSGAASGEGHPVAMTPASGYFWFFDSSSVEIVVKVVDGCALNGREWLFAAGLTNVNVFMTVTDTQTGVSRTYANPEGTPFLPIQDTDFFSACPARTGSGTAGEALFRQTSRPTFIPRGKGSEIRSPS